MFQHTIPEILPYDADPCDAVAPGADGEAVQAALDESDEIMQAALAVFPIPCMRFQMGPEGLMPQTMHHNAAALRLFGTSAGEIAKSIRRGRMIQWIHPATLPARLSVMIMAKTTRVRAMHFRGIYLRVIRDIAEGNEAKAYAKPWQN